VALQAQVASAAALVAAAASAIAAAVVVVVAAALAAPSVIAEVVLTVVSTRDVSHPRDRAREMRTAIELAELRKSLV
jgi:hypothetical protein